MAAHAAQAPTTLTLDHIAIGCASLEQGVAYIREQLGVEVPAGGKHTGRGTHNRLMRIGETVYLELIAVDPDQPKPQWPRGFGLDDPTQLLRLSERPCPVGWIAGTTDLRASLAASPIDLGRAIEMSRGDLTWQLSARVEAVPTEGGTIPFLIQWPAGEHPAARMADLGVRLERLRLLHPDAIRLAARLAAIGADHLVTVVATDGEPRIALDLRRPDGGRVTLD